MMHRFLKGIGSILLLFGCLTLYLMALVILTKPTPRPTWLGWVLLALSLWFSASTAKIWFPIFPGVLAYGALGGIVRILTGSSPAHSGNAVSVCYSWAVVGTLLVATVAAARIFGRRKNIDTIERRALSLVVLCLAVSTIPYSVAIQAGGLVGMLSILGGLLVRRSLTNSRSAIAAGEERLSSGSGGTMH
jgi:hypothetical protein